MQDQVFDHVKNALKKFDEVHHLYIQPQVPCVLESLNNLKLSDLFDLPGKNVTMNPEIFSGLSDGNKECVEKTLCPCLVLEPNSKDQLPLHVAAHVGHSAVVEALVAVVTFFSDRLSEEDRERLNPYVLRDKYRYIEGRYMDMAACLVNANQGASFLENNEGVSSLYMAVRARDASLVEAILKTTGNEDLEGKKSNLDLKLQGRNDLAHTCCFEGQKYKCVFDVILNEYPSLEDEQDEEGRTCGASIGFYEGVCNLLDRSTKSVYVCAKMNGHIRIVNEILKRCPDSKLLLNKLGQSVLHIAAKIGEDNLVKSLMLSNDTKHMGVRQDVDGNTPLHLATLNWRYRSIRNLFWMGRCGRLTLAFLLHAHMSKGSGSVKSLTKPSEPLDHEKSRDYVNTLLLVAALVATMTYAASFTIPNSSVPHIGRATLTTVPNLFCFLLFDILAMHTSVLATICTLIWAQLGDPSLVSSSLNMALPLLIFYLLCMPLAFLCGVFIAIGHVKWFLAIISLISAFFFYRAISILAPHVLLQLSNVSCGSYLEVFMYYQ
ncbi:hypothetical protein CARUB_v10000638mg [Capsella rubella]|uniref:PGG domain-containing protein n=1 Tax=Capsella rubella TaxID=81985 RepID=R0FDS9_9BRAS|nr:hypothetical protein CARUB_v10000638mg [Capsella rubella]